jgi:hypothetical protein
MSQEQSLIIVHIPPCAVPATVKLTASFTYTPITDKKMFLDKIYHQCIGAEGMYNSLFAIIPKHPSVSTPVHRATKLTSKQYAN